MQKDDRLSLGVDQTIVWDTVTLAIPPRIAILETVVPPALREEPDARG